VTVRGSGQFRRSSQTGLGKRLNTPKPERSGRVRRLPAHLRQKLEVLALEVTVVADPPAEVLYQEARPASDVSGPLLHVGLNLDMARAEREEELEFWAVWAMDSGYSPAEVAKATGLSRDWLLDQRT
jgi:hypothetical protein